MLCTISRTYKVILGAIQTTVRSQNAYVSPSHNFFGLSKVSRRMSQVVLICLEHPSDICKSPPFITKGELSLYTLPLYTFSSGIFMILFIYDFLIMVLGKRLSQL